MFVLVDMEWVTNAEGKEYPSQIAAMHVNDAWEKQDLFTIRIRPLDKSFHIWNHVGYTGGTKKEFLNANPAQSVFQCLQDWLQPEDVLCWWRGEGVALFQSFAKESNRKHVVLRPYLTEYLRSDSLSANPYRLLDKMGMRMDGVSNHSKSDVKCMRTALQAIKFPQVVLEQPCTEELFRETDTYFHSGFCLEQETGTVHKEGCALIKSENLETLPTTLSLIKKKYTPCSCCKKEFAQAHREKNRDIIQRSGYAFVYSPESNVFHKRECQLILNAKQIIGSVYYETSLSTGRCPCRVCKPEQADETAFIQTSQPSQPAVKKAPQLMPASLTKQEQRALQRLYQAQTEHKQVLANKTLPPQKREDMMVLTQPSVAFWVAAGYSSFHLRHCAKLNALSRLKGFARYEEAAREGYQPCRCCKPTSKHNLEVSLPIYSKERMEENFDRLKELCDSAGFPYTEEGLLVTLETDKAFWRVHTQKKPYRLEHKHKVCLRYFDNEKEFHWQPRIFLSLQDVVTYIKKHDNSSEVPTASNAV